MGSGLTFPGLEVEVEPNPKAFVNFDIFLNVVESDQGLMLDCDYNSDLFERRTVERWLHHFQTILDEMMAEPTRPVSAIPLVDAADRRRLLVDWNDTKAEFPRHKCIHHLFEEQVARNPEAVAITFEGRKLTYAELEATANGIARHLQSRGVGPGTTVGICLDRSPEMLISLLGILKAGGAYVPLDPTYPRERIVAVIEDARPTLVLTQDSTASVLEPASVRLLRLDREGPAIQPGDPGRPSSAVGPEDLAYVIFTSGSTGRPKGVEITHRSVVNLLTSMAREPGLTARDALVAVTTLSFDIAVLELLLPLVVGGRVIMASRQDVSDGRRLLSLMTESGATVLQGTPATWRLLLEAGWNGNPRIKVLCGGEALPRDLADTLVARSSSVWNMYGPTETTVWSAASRVDLESGPLTIGPPIANTQFYVLDRAGQPAPIGVPGELHIGGEGVAQGYRSNPELTREKFVPNPFEAGVPSRLYRTGDLVRYRPDGRLEFLGRLDSQVKVRGYRIETAEVESVVAQYQGVRECVVVAREDVPGDKRLVGYLVAGGAEASATDLRRYVASKLPEYMVPTTFVCLPSLPRTPNGKVDYRRLPVPGKANGRDERSYIAPRTTQERMLTEICARVLRLEQVGVQDSLFELGADSIHLFQIVARANDVGIPLTPKQVLSGRNVAAIVAELESQAGEKPGSPKPALAPVARENYRMKRSRLDGSRIINGRGFDQ